MALSDNRFNIQLLLVFILAIALRFGWIVVQYTDDLSNFQSGDYTLYYIGAEAIRDDHNFTNSLFLVRPPLFSIQILLLQFDNVWVLVMNAILGAIIAPLTCVLGRRFGLPCSYVFLAGVVVAFDPASIVYSAFLGPESLANLSLLVTLILILVAMESSHQWQAILWGILAGIGLTLSMLARPATFLLWIVLGIWLFSAYRHKWLAVGVFMLVSAAGMFAWTNHNQLVFGTPTYSTIGVYNLLYYRAASVEHQATQHPMNQVYKDLSTQVEARLGHNTSDVDSGTRHRHYAATGPVLGAMQSTAIEIFARYPLVYLYTIPVGLFRLLGLTDVLPNWTIPFELVWNGTLYLGALIGLWAAFRHRNWLLFWLTLLVCLYYIGGTLIVQTSGIDTRGRTMLMPILASAAIYALYQRSLGEFRRLPLSLHKNRNR